jgi:hypothetical protein
MNLVLTNYSLARHRLRTVVAVWSKCLIGPALLCLGVAQLLGVTVLLFPKWHCACRSLKTRPWSLLRPIMKDVDVTAFTNFRVGAPPEMRPALGAGAAA